MREKIIVSCVAIVIFGLIILEGFIYNGFCVAERRWLGEEELFDIAKRRVFKYYPPQRFRIPGVISKNIKNHIQYEDFDDFVRRNPDCCSLSETGWKGMTVGVFHRLTGHSAGFVRVEYAADADGFTPEDRARIVSKYTKYTGINDEKLDRLNQKNLSFVPITNCGDVWAGF